MKRGGRLLIILGIVLALAAFGGIWYIMNTDEGSEEAEPEEVLTAPVVVAAVDIPARQRISSELVTIKEMPLDYVPPMAVTSVLSATDRIALGEIYADQIIVDSMLADPESDTALIPALAVPEGMVAMSVPIDEISGVGEALRVGDHVDVIVSLWVQEHDQYGNDSHREYSAQVTIQNVEILHLGSWAPPMPDQESEDGSSGGMLGGGGGGGRSSGNSYDPLSIATLLVEPQDALVLKYAMDDREFNVRETFTFVLRGLEDEQQFSTEAVNEEYMVQRFKFARPPFIIRDCKFEEDCFGE